MLDGTITDGQFDDCRRAIFHDVVEFRAGWLQKPADAQINRSAAWRTWTISWTTNSKTPSDTCTAKITCCYSRQKCRPRTGCTNCPPLEPESLKLQPSSVKSDSMGTSLAPSTCTALDLALEVVRMRQAVHVQKYNAVIGNWSRPGSVLHFGSDFTECNCRSLGSIHTVQASHNTSVGISFHTHTSMRIVPSQEKVDRLPNFV